MALTLVLILAEGAGVAEARAGKTKLQVIAPREVEAGHPVQLTLVLSGASNVGGYEANLLFDKRSAEFAGVRHEGLGLGRNGRDVSAMEAVELDGGVAVGALTCPVRDCTAENAEKRVERGVKGSVRLATLSVLPGRSGTMKLRLAQIKVVDAQGREIPLGGRDRVVSVRVVGGPGEDTAAPARGPGWQLKDRAGRSKPRDLTADGSVTNADVSEASLSWATTRLDGTVCRPERTDRKADVNGDGCVDVADLQTVAASYTGLSSDSGSSSDTLRSASVSAAEGTFTVNSTLDYEDVNPGDGVCAASGRVCTLRAALQEASLRAGPDRINFNLPGTGVQTITIKSRLPTLSDETGPTTIDGYTQPGASPNTDPLVSNARIMVQISTDPDLVRDGLYVTSPNNTIRGVAVYGLRRAVTFFGANADGNSLLGSHVGTNAAGTFTAPVELHPADGVTLNAGASENAVGSVSPGDRNVISGNGFRGIATFGETTNNNVVYNNIIGLNPSAESRLANFRHGVDVNYGSSNNKIGGSGAGEGNLISGNTHEGVEISHEPTTSGNRIVGNRIGTDATGNGAPSYAYNGGIGVHLEDRIRNTFVSGNIIGNSRKSGIRLGSLTTGNVVEKNRIGISGNGARIPNAASGIQFDTEANTNRVGPGNIIAYNNLDGVRVANDGTVANTISRNSIFSNRLFGIDLTPLGSANVNDPGDADVGANDMLNYPEVELLAPDQIAGSACAGCTVEVFLSDGGAGDYGEGETFVQTTTADSSGRFSLRGTFPNGKFMTTTATDASGNTSEFSPNRLVSEDTTAPATPAGLQATASGQKSIDLSWRANTEPDLAGYNLYRSTQAGGPYTKVNGSTPLGATTYTDVDVRVGNSYYYVLSALDNSSNESGRSGEVSAISKDRALLFDGVDDSVAIPDSDLINSAFSGRRTFEMRLKTGADVQRQQFVYDEGGPTNGYSFEVQGGRLHFNIWADVSSNVRHRTVSTPVEAETIYHVAAVYSNFRDQVTLYVNGEPRMTTTSPGGIQPHRRDRTVIGGIDGSTRDHADRRVFAGSGGFAGKVDDFRIWDSLRSETQISADMRKDLSGSETSLVLLYLMDEGGGTTLNDATANNLDATVLGASWAETP